MQVMEERGDIILIQSTAAPAPSRSLLALARNFATMRLSRAVRFVAFTNEEPPVLSEPPGLSIPIWTLLLLHREFHCVRSNMENADWIKHLLTTFAAIRSFLPRDERCGKGYQTWLGSHHCSFWKATRP
jgi:hypothetical protein